MAHPTRPCPFARGLFSFACGWATNCNCAWIVWRGPQSLVDGVDVAYNHGAERPRAQRTQKSSAPPSVSHLRGRWCTGNRLTASQPPPNNRDAERNIFDRNWRMLFNPFQWLRLDKSLTTEPLFKGAP
jgi:hypothetical protein